MCFRFNTRKNPYLFRDTMLKLIGWRKLNTRTSPPMFGNDLEQYNAEFSHGIIYISHVILPLTH